MKKEEIETYFKNKIKTKLDLFKTYNKELSYKTNMIEDRRKEISEKLESDPESEISLEAYEFAYFDFTNLSRDINIVATEIYYTHLTSVELGLEVELSTEDSAIISNLRRNMATYTFQVKDGEVRAINPEKRKAIIESKSFEEKREEMLQLAEELLGDDNIPQ